MSVYVDEGRRKRADRRNGKRVKQVWAVLGGVFLAVLLWMVLFHLEWGNFWLLMAFSILLLSSYSLVVMGNQIRKLFRWRTGWLLWGMSSAALLYLLFWAGDAGSRFLFDFAHRQIGSIYARKLGESDLMVGLLLFFLIGPGEELFWRGFVQNQLSRVTDSALSGFLGASFLYGGVHLWSFNFILFMAALVCGFFWGSIYCKTGNLWPVILSHSLWDLAVFVLFPLTQV